MIVACLVWFPYKGLNPRGNLFSVAVLDVTVVCHFTHVLCDPTPSHDIRIIYVLGLDSLKGEAGVVWFLASVDVF